MDFTFDEIRDFAERFRNEKTDIQVKWDYYRNDVARKPYFPQGEKESSAEYRKRMKIPVGWPAKIVDRKNSYFRKPPITYIFDENGDTETERAQLAAALWEEMSNSRLPGDAAGKLGKIPYFACRDAGVGGKGFTKEDIIFYDQQTGEPLTTVAEGKTFTGQVIAHRINEAFMFLQRDKYGVTFIEAWARRGGEYRHIYDIAGEDSSEWTTYIEIIQPASYDVRKTDKDGAPKRLRQSRHLIIKDEEVIYDAPLPYRRVPIQPWINSIGQSEYAGASDIQRAIPLAQAINFIVTGTTRSVYYHGWPKVIISGLEDESELRMTIDGATVAPPNAQGEAPTIDLLTWDQNIDGALGLINYLGDVMCSVEDIPRGLLHSLDGIGKVSSGVALRTMYAPLNELCQDKEIGLGRAEEAFVMSCLDILATHNNYSGFDNVNVTVQYNQDRTPRDLQMELKETEQTVAAGAGSAVDIYLAAHPEVATREKALERILETIVPEKMAIREAKRGREILDYASYQEIALRRLEEETRLREKALDLSKEQ